jgi:hypothetical protein
MNRRFTIAMLRYGRYAMAGVIIILMVLDFGILGLSPSSFAIGGKYIEFSVVLLIMQYLYRKQTEEGQ